MNAKHLHYAGIQAVPDPVRDERVNVGVVAWDQAARSGACRFSTRLHRLKALGVTDTSFVSSFRGLLEEAVHMEGDRLFGAPSTAWSLDAMTEGAQEWAGMIQLTPPRAAKGTNAEQLIDEVFERFVRLQAPADSSKAGRSAIRPSAARVLRQSIRARWGEQDPPVHVAVAAELSGQSEIHEFDVVLVNGRPAGALVTPNLRDPRVKEVVRDLDAAEWAIRDARAATPSMVFGLLTDPRATQGLRDRMERMASRLDTALLEGVDSLEHWSQEPLSGFGRQL